jgi:NADPH:quinone reductase-like Zn-dependent oxidoreductase
MFSKAVRYITVFEHDIALKPEEISFAQAAALGVTGSAALQILDKLVTIGKGSEVLINGATGGIGMFLVQLIKGQGGIVTSVVSENGLALAHQWKSDFVIDYRKENVIISEKKYDVVIDLSGKMPFRIAKSIMKPSSTYVNTIPSPKEIIGSMVNNLIARKKYKVLVLKPSVSYLEAMAKEAKNGLDIIIGESYHFASFKNAYREATQRQILGKAVILLSNQSSL